MTWKVTYHPDVRTDDLPPIPRNLRERIRKSIEQRLQTEPEQYGKKLRKDLAGRWKLRVGDYRVVFELRRNEVFILAMAHRRDVYRLALKRTSGW